jgi:uncharacterized protein YlzI (FlbEa/FlbD family)
MKHLANVTDMSGKPLFINPDHVRTVREIQSGTEITFSDGTKMTVHGTMHVVVASIQAAAS